MACDRGIVKLTVLGLALGFSLFVYAESFDCERPLRVPNDERLLYSLQKNHGFSQSVAQRVNEEIPDLALAIDADLSGVYDALRIYRGFKMPPFKLDFTGHKKSYYPNSTNGLTWFSVFMGTAEFYARSAETPYTTILEIEIPKFMFKSKFQSSFSGKDSLEIAKLGYPTGTIDQKQKELADIRPFVTRVGIMVRNRPSWQIHWLSYEQALSLGLFDKEIDYSIFFK